MPPESGLPSIGEVDYVLDYRSTPSDTAVGSFAELLRSFAKQLVQSARQEQSDMNESRVLA